MGKVKSLSLAISVLMIASLISVPHASASPDVIYVPTDYPTIQAAIEAASSGDTIIVGDGVYSESLKVM